MCISEINKQMTKLISVIMLLFIALTVQAQITMTTEKAGKVEVCLKGSGSATIDWGDGSNNEIFTLDNSPYYR
jgi:hypothetical protein